MAQRSAIGKAALPPQTEPGTARGLAKQVQVLLPLPKKSGIAAAVPDFFVSEQKDLAARCARRLSCGACRGALVACGALPRTDRGGSRDKSVP